MAIKKLLFFSFIVLITSSCGSVVTRQPSNESGRKQAIINEIGDVSISIAPEAYEQVSEYEKFSTDDLRRSVVTELAKRNVLIVDPELPKMKVEVTNFRVRSGAAAVIFGVLAGRDNLAANITILSVEGNEMDNFEVSTSYMWGGYLGGSYDRVSYLYNSFAKNLADEFGAPSE